MIRLLPVLLLFLPLFASVAAAEGTDITADELSRDAAGVVVASGNVVIRRKGGTLHADEVRYDIKRHQIQARGHVIIESPRAVIHADSAQLDTETKQGVMQHAVIILPDGERLAAARLERVNDHTYHAEDIRFTACPTDEEAWNLAAVEATLDQQAGKLTARHTRFEAYGVPVLYSPYWKQPLRRMSGFLVPRVGVGKRRGTEVAIPYYFAPAPDWDATLTPHWMSKRGFMPEVELRHVSLHGSETVNFEGLDDKLTGSQRGRLQGDIHWHMPFSTEIAIQADHVSDHDYLADFAGGGEDASTRYLQSQASLSQQGKFGDWTLLARHQQDLTRPSNAQTLQIVPRLESRLFAPLGAGLIFHFDQQTTRFDRRTGTDGWRMDLHPYLELPWELAGGGITATLQAGTHHTRYWLRDTPNPATPIRTTGEVSLEVRPVLERIAENREWRHTISPVLRYDYVAAPDQANLPNFDSAFGQLTMSNFLSGNRFSGHDRIERVHRISLMFETGVQARMSEARARDVATLRIGAAYDFIRETVDASLKPAPTRPFTNLLGELLLNPLPGLSLHADGQYDPSGNFWPVAHASLDWHARYGHKFRAAYRFTDARYAEEAQIVDVSGEARLGQRWYANAGWQYDTLLKLTQRLDGGIRYQHPCWSVMVDVYRTNRPSGTAQAADVGFRFLLDFKGLGSFGT